MNFKIQAGNIKTLTSQQNPI